MQNDRAEMRWDFQIQADKQVTANQPDAVEVHKLHEKAAVIEILWELKANWEEIWLKGTSPHDEL